MTEARFVQIHWLASYPAALPNRDEAGLAKRMPFGGAVRARISSQCLKRRWRLAGADRLEKATDNPWSLQALDKPMGLRTKELVEKRIMPEARREAPEAGDETAEAVEEALLLGLYGKKAADIKSRQALFFGEPEIDYLKHKAVEALGRESPEAASEHVLKIFKDEDKNFRTLKDGAGLESALFGRMVTSDPSANRDAAIHVAHAMSVHAIERELDFMTVVDDLTDREAGDDAGAAGIFDMELASGLYYGYAVVDVPLLVANLGDDRETAAKVTEHLVHLIAQISPGAKKGSTAPYAWAELVLAEAGDRQPRTLANAFRRPVGLGANDLGDEAVRAMDGHLTALDSAYGSAEARRQLAVGDGLAGVDQLDLDGLAAWAAGAVREGAAQ